MSLIKDGCSTKIVFNILNIKLLENSPTMLSQIFIFILSKDNYIFCKFKV